MPPAPSLKSPQALSSDVARACREINALTDKIKNVDYEINGLTDQLKHAKRKLRNIRLPSVGISRPSRPLGRTTGGTSSRPSAISVAPAPMS